MLATLKNSTLPLGVDTVCSTGFDRDDEFFATVGVSKRIKVFEYAKVTNSFLVALARNLSSPRG